MQIHDSENDEGFVRRAALSAVWLGFAQMIRILLTLLSTIVIARLLSPDDYGVIAMAAPVTGFVAIFQELGLGAATVQSRTLTQGELTAMFWVNVVTSLVFAAILVAIAPFAAWFYGDVRAGYVTAAGAGAVLISGLALQHAALLNRDMRFGRSSAIEVINALAGFFAAALLALLFRNYWALVLGPLTGLAIQTVLTWRSINWVPGRISFSEARRFARFGSGVTGYNLVSFVSRNADNILIAKVVGTASLGIYDRSYKLMMLPLQTLNGPVNRLLFPLLSRLQDDPERYRRTFVFAVRAVGLLTIPGIAIAAALSQRLMPFLLGHAWTAAGPIFFWLGLAGLFNPIGNMTTLLFLTSGRTDAFFRFGLFSTIVTVAAFGVGVRWGGEGVAASLFFTTALRTPLLFLYSVRQTGVRASDLFGAQFEPLLAAALSAAVALEIEPYLETGQLLSVAFPIAYTIGIVLALATQPGRHAVFRIFTIAQDSITRISTRMHSMFVRTD